MAELVTHTHHGLVLPLANQPALDVSNGKPAGNSLHGAKFQDQREQSSEVSLHSCEESTSLHEEVGDSTDPPGSSEELTFVVTGNEDGVYDSEYFTYTHYGIHDPLKESADPFLQQPAAHATSVLQPCVSECSSVISLVNNAADEATSRLDNTYMSVDGTESHWTDAKHGSYLHYMETNFVNSLFGREYCALDVCGQGPLHQESKSSSPWPSSLIEFKSWKSGDWHWRSVLKPPLPTFITLPLLKSPWVDHFRHHQHPRAKCQHKKGLVSSSCSADGEEEVNSPAMELHRGMLRHLHASRSKSGHEDYFFCKNRRGCDEAVGISKQQEFAPDTENESFSNAKKRRF